MHLKHSIKVYMSLSLIFLAFPAHSNQQQPQQQQLHQQGARARRNAIAPNGEQAQIIQQVAAAHEAQQGGAQNAQVPNPNAGNPPPPGGPQGGHGH